MTNSQRLISFTDLNIENIDFTQLKDSPYIPTQQIAFINHKITNNKIFFQSPYVITECYGLPPKDSPFHPPELRAFYKFPFCHGRKKYNDDLNYDKIEAFYNKIKELDEYFGSEELKDTFFGVKTSINMSINH